MMQMCRDNRLNMCNGDVSLDPATRSTPALCCKLDTARSQWATISVENFDMKPYLL